MTQRASGQNSEITWGKSLQGRVVNDNPLTFSERFITIQEEYSRVWTLRAIVTYNRPLDIGAGDIAQLLVRVKEGAGFVSVAWTFALVGLDGTTQTPQIDGSVIPQSFAQIALPVCGSAFNVDGELTLAAPAANGPLVADASVWVAPITPVYPPGLRT